MTSPTPTIRIWDLPIRLFHWGLVLAVLGLYLTAEFSEFITDQLSSHGIYIDVIVWHSRLGFFVLSLLLFRLLWGFLGSESAKFARMLFSVKAIIRYVKSEDTTPKVDRIGHNPLGAYSVFIMLTLLLMQTVSGLFADDEIAFMGPLAQYASTDFINAMTSWHHINFDVLTIFIGLHIVAIAVYQWVLKEPLIRRITRSVIINAPSAKQPIATRTSLARALALYIMCVAIVYFIVS